jgi:cellulose synthase/poly-beta-1,6-N-acetylglucosamine synthase-like glycosyltransferase
VVTPLTRQSLLRARGIDLRLPPAGLTFYQTIEYALDFAWRLGWETANGAHVMSGCATSFRRDLLIQAGGFHTTTVTEDYEVIHRLRRWCAEHAMAHKVLTAPRARAFTEAPLNFAALMRQRIRWFHGFLQTQIAYRALIGRFRYGWFGTLTMPVKTVDAVSPALVAVALVGFLICFGVWSSFDLSAAVAATLAARLVIDCFVGSITLALRQDSVAPFYDQRQTAKMSLALPLFYVINRSLWLVIGLCAYWRLATGSGRW